MRATDAAQAHDERELIEQAKRDRAAFAILYRRHYSAIAGYVYRRVGDMHVTEDLVSDVFMSALRSLAHFHHRGLSLRAWLYRIATNRVNRWARREQRHALRTLQVEPVMQHPNGDEQRLSERARQALLSLAPKYQAVLAMHYLESMPVSEVAEALGCRIGTVKSRLARGRDQMRQRLEQRRSRT